MLDSLGLDTASIVALFGTVVVPIVTSLLKREGWSTKAKQVLAAATAFALAVFEVADQEALSVNFETIVAHFAAIYTAAQAAYLGFWEKAGERVDGLLTSIPLLPDRGAIRGE